MALWDGLRLVGVKYNPLEWTMAYRVKLWLFRANYGSSESSTALRSGIQLTEVDHGLSGRNAILRNRLRLFEGKYNFPSGLPIFRVRYHTSEKTTDPQNILGSSEWITTLPRWQRFVCGFSMALSYGLIYPESIRPFFRATSFGVFDESSES